MIRTLFPTEAFADRLDRRYPHEKVWLVYKGAGVPSYYGIDAADPRKEPPGEDKAPVSGL